MQAQLQSFERGARDHQLAVQHEVVFFHRLERTRHLGKIPIEWLLVSRLKMDAASAPVREAAEAVVLRLELPPASRGQSLDCFGFHRWQIERQRGRSSGHRFTGFSRQPSPRNPPSRPGAQCAASHLAAAAAAPWPQSMARPAMSPTPTAQSGSPAWPWDGSSPTSALGAEVRNPNRSARTGPSLTFRTDVQRARCRRKRRAAWLCAARPRPVASDRGSQADA